MQKTTTVDINIQENDFIELISNVPALRLKQYKSALIIIIINTILCFLLIQYGKSLNFTTAEYNTATFSAIVLHVILTIIFLTLLRKKTKKMIREIAKERFKEPGRSNVTFNIDIDLNVIKINKRNIKLGNDAIVIISTSKNYLIYLGNKVDDDKVLIPKIGDSNYIKDVNAIIDYLSKLKNTKIIEKNK
ncbi:hypothetical protein M3936_19080 [Sutcliffiella horikoshii]|uniref:hypothetical protein n=1 Tax=Sutcliffiella horikoshii TaxID=79883 RepID=UPI00203FA0C6|nr:hypothetical protein [Sutcliffiella horikoshii]MCM3619678.1 hypothetical protein [Sutcliffiella horikoshii]